jgi:hypothetical protein
LVADVGRRSPVPEQQEQAEEFQRHHRRRLLVVVATDGNRPAVGTRLRDRAPCLTHSGARVGLFSALQLQPERPAAGRQDVGFLGAATARLRQAALRLDADLHAEPRGDLALEAVAFRSARLSAHQRTIALRIAVVTR